MAKAFGKKNWLTVKSAVGDEPAVMRIDGSIGKSWYDDSGTSSKEFNEELDKIPKGTPISLYVNSTGGSVGDGMAIYNAIAERAEDVTCCISGYALSIASVIPLAAGKIYSPTASIWMMHDPLTYTEGNEADHAETIKMLRTHADTMAEIYAAKTGKTKDEVRATMKAETWMSGNDAIAYGLADEMPEEDVEMSFAPLDWSKFKNAPINSLFKTQTTMKPIVLPVASVPTLPAAPIAAIPATVVADSSVLTAEIAAIRAQLASEKKTRVTNEVNALAEGRIPNDQVERWITRAIADETVIADLRTMPVMTPGGLPIPFGGTFVEASDRFTEIKKLPTAKAKFEAMKEEWESLYGRAQAQEQDHARRGLPVATNTYSSSLVTNFLINGSQTQLQNRWAALQAFTRDFGTDSYKPKATGELKFVTGGATGQKNPTNWESGDSVVAAVPITVDQYSQSFQVSSSDLNNGLRMENLVDVNMAVFADTIIQAATAPVTAANFSTLAPVTYASGAFGFSELQLLWGNLKKSTIKNIILDGPWLGRVLNQPGNFQAGYIDGQPGSFKNYGWDGLYLNTNWTGADPNVIGLACNPQALGTISGLPLVPPNIPGATLQETRFMVPGPNITVAMYSWFSLATRTMWCSYDLMFGAAKLDGTAGQIIKGA